MFFLDFYYVEQPLDNELFDWFDSSIAEIENV